MTATPEQRAEYLAHHAAQLPVLDTAGQENLLQKTVHDSGAGRIGNMVMQFLAAAGVGNLSANDPQSIEPENMGSFLYLRKPDLGTPKVIALAKFLDSRPHLVFEPVVAGTEEAEVDKYVAKADLLLSSANDLGARLVADRKAAKHGIPVVQVAAFDGRERLGGLITIRRPENIIDPCFGCLLTEDLDFPRGEGLLTTVTTSLAAIASTMIVQILTGVRSDFLDQHNVLFIDLETYSIEALCVQRRKNCSICGQVPYSQESP